MLLQQTLDSRLKTSPIIGQSFLDLVGEGSQLLTRDVTVIGSAENLLHLLHSRVELGAVGAAKTASKNFHRITQPLSQDANAMESLVIGEILRGGLIEIL